MERAILSFSVKFSVELRVLFGSMWHIAFYPLRGLKTVLNSHLGSFLINGEKKINTFKSRKNNNICYSFLLLLGKVIIKMIGLCERPEIKFGYNRN